MLSRIVVVSITVHSTHCGIDVFLFFEPVLTLRACTLTEFRDELATDVLDAVLVVRGGGVETDQFYRHCIHGTDSPLSDCRKPPFPSPFSTVPRTGYLSHLRTITKYERI